MYVKYLRLAGFKSFADPTTLEFEPAVNVVVGPNGSGKSNIADALSWVLGSQAPSTLRGASMEDVIFAGSDGRPRLGLAEVELTFDNFDRALPLDLNEVTITRIADRSGTSEYRINGAPCRLLDVAELLSDTGIGRSIHTVVGQGQLDAILQARPEDRRAFIEEAAQIGKYRRRKDRSLKKIERVEDNLARLNDILSELRRSVRPLKRQASAAAQSSELMSEQRTLRQRVTATEINRLLRADEQVDPEAEARRAELLSDELASIRARIETAAARQSGLTEAADQATTVSNNMGRTADRLAGLARLAAERVATVSARLAAETEEGYRERIRLLEGERVRWGAEGGRLDEDAAGLRADAQRIQAIRDERRSERERAERALSEARAEETAAAQALVRAEGSEAAGRATVGAVEARVRAVIERREVAGRELESATTAVARAENEVRALEADLDRRTEQATAAEERYRAEHERAGQLKEARGASRSDRAAATARADALEDVIAALSDMPAAVQRIEPLRADARERARIATADEAEAERILETAEQRVEASALVVADHDRELRRLDALIAGSADRLAGFRRKREQREIELAALDDELARTRDAQAAAERSAAEERAALPARRAALEETRTARDDAEGALAAAKHAETEVAARATAAEIEARGAEERALAAHLRLEEAVAGIADAESALAGLEQLRAALRVARDAARAVAEAAQAAAERGARWATEADAHSAAAHAAAQEGDVRLAALRARERELGSKLESVARARSEAEVRRAENRARLQAIGERAMDEWAMTLDDFADLDPLEADEESEARARVDQLQRAIARLGPVNPRAAEEYAELSDREAFLVGQIEDLKASRRDLLRVVREVDETIVTVFEEAYTAVEREFEAVFERLFPGGTGRLRLTDPDDLLAAGIEIEARPPGKNVRKLSLLSGGERSLVALAFLFAIFRSRPSPFYLLDEVEAALDDVNLARFLSLVAELETRAQVLIVTHQKRTMEAADVLYGVSMSKDGVSVVIAKRLDEVELNA